MTYLSPAAGAFPGPACHPYPKVQTRFNVAQSRRCQLRVVPQYHRFQARCIYPVQPLLSIIFCRVAVSIKLVSLQPSRRVQDENLEHRLAKSKTCLSFFRIAQVVPAPIRCAVIFRFPGWRQSFREKAHQAAFQVMSISGCVRSSSRAYKPTSECRETAVCGTSSSTGSLCIPLSFLTLSSPNP